MLRKSISSGIQVPSEFDMYLFISNTHYHTFDMNTNTSYMFLVFSILLMNVIVFSCVSNQVFSKLPAKNEKPTSSSILNPRSAKIMSLGNKFSKTPQSSVMN